MDDVVNFDAVEPESLDDLRHALLDQLAYLVDEVEALRTVVASVPPDVQAGRPTPADLTMKEIYGLIATLDRDVRPAQVQQVADGDAPALVPPNPDRLARESGWNDRAMADILTDVQAARRAFVERLRDLPLGAWTEPATYDGDDVTLAELLHRYARADLDRLRDLGYRLHDADLSDREPSP